MPRHCGDEGHGNCLFGDRMNHTFGPIMNNNPHACSADECSRSRSWGTSTKR